MFFNSQKYRMETNRSSSFSKVNLWLPYSACACAEPLLLFALDGTVQVSRETKRTAYFAVEEQFGWAKGESRNERKENDSIQHKGKGEETHTYVRAHMRAHTDVHRDRHAHTHAQKNTAHCNASGRVRQASVEVHSNSDWFFAALRQSDKYKTVKADWGKKRAWKNPMSHDVVVHTLSWI